MVVRPIAAVGFTTLALLLSSCGSRIPEPHASAHPTDALVEVDYPPPPARVEFVPDPPSDDAVWVKGEWLWSGRRWSWRPGVWVVPPAGAGFARRVLVRRSDGKLFFAPGTWRDKQGREIPAPPEKVARSRSGAVVNPEGETEPTGADIQHDGGAASKEPSSDEYEADAGAR
jgi:hypothetical protein